MKTNNTNIVDKDFKEFLLYIKEQIESDIDLAFQTNFSKLVHLKLYNRDFKDFYKYFKNKYKIKD